MKGIRQHAELVVAVVTLAIFAETAFLITIPGHRIGPAPTLQTEAEIVAIDRAHQIYRDCGIGLTTEGKSRPEPREFIRFLQSPQGAQIFRKWGWSAQP